MATIQGVYLALFGRPADPLGLSFFNTATGNGADLTAIGDLTSTAEYQARFAGQSTTQVITSIYQSLFNREPDLAGLTYFANALASGTLTMNNIAIAIYDGAQGADKTTLALKEAAANAFTAAIDTVAEINGYTGATALAAASAFIAGVTTTAPDAAAVTAAVAAATTGGAGGVSKTLTLGADVLTGTAGNDTFTAGDQVNGGSIDTTLTAGDNISGGAGNDTFNWVTDNSLTTVPAGVTLTSIETINATSGGGMILDATTAFAGATTLNTTSTQDQTVTAAKTQNVVATITNMHDHITINGGNNVTVNAAASVQGAATTTGTTTIGNTSAAAGDVVVNVTNSTGGTTTGAISVTGGKTISITSKAANAVNTTVTQSAVTVTGDANTTTVTVKQDAAATASTTVAGKVAGEVDIFDANVASATKAGTITTVTLSNYGTGSDIESSALTTVNLSGTGATLGLNRGDLTATPTANTLALNVNGLTTTGEIEDLTADAGDDGFTTINLAATGTASKIAELKAIDVTDLNISGDAKLTLSAHTLTSLKNVTVTNTAGASLGTALATGVLFTGGAGADSVSLGATTKAITMGAGDDVVTMSTTTLGTGGSVNGGEGKDTLIANTNGSAFSADPNFGGFEVLRVAGGSAQGSHNANGFTELQVGQLAAAATFTNVAANVGLTVLAGTTAGTTVTLTDATGTADVFGLTLKSDATIAANTVTLAGIETVNITNTDSLTTTANTNTLTLAATAAKSVVVTGNAGLTLTNTGNTKITSFDASGVTGAASDAAALAVTFASANTTVGELVTIKGGSGNDVLTGTATANDTIIGNDGDDTLTYNGGTDLFTGGAGADTFTLSAVGTKTAYLTVSDAAKTDKLGLGGVSGATIADATLGAKVSLGGGATFDQYLDAAAALDGSTAALVKWFQFDTNTYVVVDNDAGVTFVSGTDALIKLTGTIDLSTSALASEILTIA